MKWTAIGKFDKSRRELLVAREWILSRVLFTETSLRLACSLNRYSKHVYAMSRYVFSS
jgi:hypothetical protein